QWGQVSSRKVGTLSWISPTSRAPDVRQPAWWQLCLASPEELAMMALLDGLRLHCDAAAAAAAAAARCKAWLMVRKRPRS
ncbi:hypothetical protein, partial [Xanthomonas perforans]